MLHQMMMKATRFFTVSSGYSGVNKCQVRTMPAVPLSVISLRTEYAVFVNCTFRPMQWSFSTRDRCIRKWSSVKSREQTNQACSTKTETANGYYCVRCRVAQWRRGGYHRTVGHSDCFCHRRLHHLQACQLFRRVNTAVWRGSKCCDWCDCLRLNRDDNWTELMTVSLVFLLRYATWTCAQLTPCF